MKSEIKNQTKTEVEFEITISSEELNSFIEKAIKELGKDVEIKGFRKGNAPKNVIEEHFGEQRILTEAADLAVNDSYSKAVIEHKIDAIFHPNVDVKKLAKGNDFVYTAKTAILPKIELPDYKEIASKMKRSEVEITDQEITQAMDWLKRSRSKLTVKNGPAEKGNFIEIEYTLSKTGTPEKPTFLKDSFVLGEGRFLAGFEDNLIGMKAGEEKKGVTLKKGEEEILIDIKVVSVQNMELPEVNDEFAKSLGNFNDLEALKNNVKEGIKREKEEAEVQKIRNDIIESISKETKIEIPSVLIENEQRQMLEGLKSQILQALKMSFEDYLEKTKKTEKDLLESLKSEAEKKIKRYLILKEIGIKEDIKVSDDEVKEEVNKVLANYPSVEEAEKNIGADTQKFKEYTREVIKSNKIFELLDNLIPKK